MSCLTVELHSSASSDFYPNKAIASFPTFFLNTIIWMEKGKLHWLNIHFQQRFTMWQGGRFCISVFSSRSEQQSDFFLFNRATIRVSTWSLKQCWNSSNTQAIKIVWTKFLTCFGAQWILPFKDFTLKQWMKMWALTSLVKICNIFLVLFLVNLKSKLAQRMASPHYGMTLIGFIQSLLTPISSIVQ